MKLYAVISPLCMLFSQGIMPAQAQQLAGGKILVDSVLARKNGNQMDVAFRMNLNDLKMKSEQQLVFTPVMVGADSIALNPIIIQGRNQAVRYRRRHRLLPARTKPVSRFTSPSLFLIRNG